MTNATMGDSEFLSPRQVAEIFGVKVWAVYSAVHRGELRATKFSNLIRIHPVWVREFAEENMIEPDPKFRPQIEPAPSKLKPEVGSLRALAKKEAA